MYLKMLLHEFQQNLQTILIEYNPYLLIFYYENQILYIKINQVNNRKLTMQTNG